MSYHECVFIQFIEGEEGKDYYPVLYGDEKPHAMHAQVGPIVLIPAPFALESVMRTVYEMTEEMTDEKYDEWTVRFIQRMGDRALSCFNATGGWLPREEEEKGNFGPTAWHIEERVITRGFSDKSDQSMILVDVRNKRVYVDDEYYIVPLPKRPRGWTWVQVFPDPEVRPREEMADHSKSGCREHFQYIPVEAMFEEK